MRYPGLLIMLMVAVAGCAERMEKSEKAKAGKSMAATEPGRQMIKLYKRIDGQLHYKEAWRDDTEVTLHWGIVGQRGQSETYPIDGEDTKEPAVENALQDAYAEGYQEIAEEEQTEVVVQYRLETWGSPDDLKQRHRVEEVLNECLGWTGNGHCDGGDIGSGTINTYSYVADAEKAGPTIVEALRAAGLLDVAIIAIEKGEDYRVVWPKDFTGEFSPL